MKLITIFILTVVMAFSLCACGCSNTEPATTPPATTRPTTAPTTEATVMPTETMTVPVPETNIPDTGVETGEPDMNDTTGSNNATTPMDGARGRMQRRPAAH